MKRSVAVAMTLLLTVGVLFAQGQSENTKSVQSEEYPEITLKMGTSSAENTLTSKAFKEWGTRLSTLTNGKMKIDVYCSSVLGNNEERVQGAQLGSIDITVQQPGGCADMGASKMKLFTLPYLFKSRTQYVNVLMGDVGNQLLQDVTDNVQGIVGFSYLPDGGRCFFTHGKPLTKLADGKGLKMRVQPYEMDTAMAKALGFIPTPISFSELYTSLQSGVVDGAENPLSGIDGNKLYEVSDYLILDNHTYNILVMLFSAKTWNKLPAKAQDALKTTWKATIDEFYNPQLESSEKELLEKYQANGMHITSDVADFDQWVAAVKPLWQKYGAGLDDLIKAVNDQQ